MDGAIIAVNDTDKARIRDAVDILDAADILGPLVCVLAAFLELSACPTLIRLTAFRQEHSCGLFVTSFRMVPLI